ncbi:MULTISPECIES: HAD-IA family hydrolase [unclassified Streptomyces]|uniref:HAD family hydrolase n=1 Tax=unclassified Streptomyces TaxID=2593676 RepID=UPI000368720F|nr:MULTISPECIES: HAD-IA family hydrolase [unclassified Streptomyces]MYT28756.1 HAD-IA family hydrolase [Streptomyces sp. SID8354]
MDTMTTTNGAPGGTAGGGIDGVLFDFSGTLLRIEPALSWLRASLAAFHAAPGTPPCPLTGDEIARLAAELERAGALPGGATPVRVPDELAALWDVRDRDTRHHRALYTGLARQVPLPHPELYDRPGAARSLYDVLYERHRTPDAWLPYPDAAEVLTALDHRGIRTGVLSNIGWDLRPVLRAHGLDRHLTACVLSYEHTLQKPDPRLFTLACRELGVAPAHVLMVGDDRTTDGGATAVGCAYFPVEPLPVHRRPGGLRPVLDLVG